MSVQQMLLAWQEPDLTPGQRLVLMALAYYSDKQGRNAFCSERTIAAHNQLSIRTVKSSLAFLRAPERQLISVQEEPTNRRSTTWQLHLPGGAMRAPQTALTWGAKTTPHGGANRAPLEVIPVVQSLRAGGAVSANHATTPYKEDPVLNQDPGLISLLSKAVAEFPGYEGITLLQALERWAIARRLPANTDLLAKAIELARVRPAAARVSA